LTPFAEGETPSPPLLVNAELVRMGLARARAGRDSGPRAAEIIAAEREARAARRGTWSARHPGRIPPQIAPGDPE
jgi:endonuclease YncB( thermonuclease family)